MANKSDKRLEVEEKITELFSDKHRKALLTSEVIDNVGVDLDRSIYIKILRDHERIYELKKNDVILWILPRMRQFRTLETRISDLENEVNP